MRYRGLIFSTVLVQYCYPMVFPLSQMKYYSNICYTATRFLPLRLTESYWKQPSNPFKPQNAFKRFQCLLSHTLAAIFNSCLVNHEALWLQKYYRVILSVVGYARSTWGAIHKNLNFLSPPTYLLTYCPLCLMAQGSNKISSLAAVFSQSTQFSLSFSSIPHFRYAVVRWDVALCDSHVDVASFQSGTHHATAYWFPLQEAFTCPFFQNQGDYFSVLSITRA